jgi:hypothetical protein
VALKNGNVALNILSGKSDEAMETAELFVLRTDGEFCHGQDTETAQNIRLSKPTDMTIHWKLFRSTF